MDRTRENINRLLKIIENQIGRGNGNTWNGYDFEWLSDSIQEKTGEKISSLTLKRLWGKVNYDSKPSISTLNILAQYGGYNDFRDSVLQQLQNSEKEIMSVISNKKRTIALRKIFLSVISILALSLVVWLLSKNGSSKRTLDAKEFNFSIDKVGNNLPSSVVFRYESKNTSSEDVLQIQQSWNTKRRTQVNQNDSIHTSIYYYPGYYEAKLVVNDKVVKEKPLLIPSKGWIAAIDRKTIPQYLNDSEFRYKDSLSISKDLLKAYNIVPETEEVWTVLSYVKEFEGLYADNFNFKANLKNESIGGVNICQNTELLILLEGDAIIIPFSLLGCIANLYMYVPSVEIRGKNNDLSNFGIDLSNWQTVELISKNNVLSVLVNNQIIYTIPTEASNPIYGLRVRFQGAGNIANAVFKNNLSTYELK